MSEQKEHKKQRPQQSSREDRLKAALKANLGRRKAQAKTRTSVEHVKEQTAQVKTPEGDTEE